ncbi:NADH dehydrogenase, partial [Vibrio xuii]
LAMVLTDMWIPIVAGAFILTGLTVEAWIRVAHIIPMHEEMRVMKKQIRKLESEVRTLEYEE